MIKYILGMIIGLLMGFIMFTNVNSFDLDKYSRQYIKGAKDSFFTGCMFGGNVRKVSCEIYSLEYIAPLEALHKKGIQ